MFGDLSILKQAGALARHAAARHEVISENIANADTPGYKAKALKPFDPKLAEKAEGGDFRAAKRMVEPEPIDAPASPNGNTVVLEDQMVLAADAQAQHRAALAVYKKSLELLRTAMSSRR